MFTAIAALFVAVCSSTGLQAGAQPGDRTPRATVSPYAEVDWENWEQHRANLHTHTTQSDGGLTPDDVIDRYHARGFTVLALTDHDTHGPGSDSEHPQRVKTTWPWKQFARDPDNLGMVAIEGAEVGAHHIGSYFNDYGSVEGYDTPYVWRSSEQVYRLVGEEAEVKAVEETERTLEGIRNRDGLAVMFHPGLYKHPTNWYVRLFRQHDHLVGLEVYNGFVEGDTCPRDRGLWDEVLTALMPDRPVWGFSNDDMHRPDQMGCNYQMLLLPELTTENVREAIGKGRFYFCRVYGDGQTAPVIKSIRLDPKAHTITIEAEGCQDILWVSGGKIVTRGSTFIPEKARGAAHYVRAQLRGEHGYTCTQPFPLTGQVTPVVLKHIVGH